MDSYRTVKQESTVEFVERRSRFIGRCRPVTTEEEALAFLNEIRSRHWDASHNVYGYSLREGQLRRYSDDGEPQGTAGMPVLDVLSKSETCDAILVVTRYFGGVLLGAGGLVRAYSHCASLALEAAGVVTMRRCLKGELACSYNQYGRIDALIPACGGRVEQADFLDHVRLAFFLPEENVGQFCTQLRDATCGEVEACMGEAFYTAL